jgi:hypothetical protein
MEGLTPTRVGTKTATSGLCVCPRVAGSLDSPVEGKPSNQFPILATPLSQTFLVHSLYQSLEPI